MIVKIDGIPVELTEEEAKEIADRYIELNGRWWIYNVFIKTMAYLIQKEGFEPFELENKGVPREKIKSQTLEFLDWAVKNYKDIIEQCALEYEVEEDDAEDEEWIIL